MKRHPLTDEGFILATEATQEERAVVEGALVVPAMAAHDSVHYSVRDWHGFLTSLPAISPWSTV